MGKIIEPERGDDGAVLDRLMDRQARMQGVQEQLRRDLKTVTAAVQGINETLRDVFGIGEEEEVDGPNPRPRGWWEPIDPAAAQDTLTELAGWVTDVWCAWPDGAKLPGCWPWHRAAITELWVCYEYWTAAGQRKDRLTYRADWVDRVRPRTVERLSNIVPMECHLAKHAPRRDGRIEAAEAETLAGHAVRELSWVAGAYANKTPLPHPSPDVISTERAARERRLSNY